jgi:ribosome maturation factor RimP
LVTVHQTDDRRVTGRVVSADAEGVDLDIDGTATRIAYSDVTKARVEVEFSRPASGSQQGSDGALGPEEE